MEILPVFKHALLISFFVFVMMLIVDFVDTASKRRISGLMRGGLWRQYFLSAFLGSTPGCLGAFMNVSLYVHGMISFGAIVGGMIATSGDEAFVMLSQFPLTAMALFILLFFSGIIFAWISDKLIILLKFTPCESCYEALCEQCEPDTSAITSIKDGLRVKRIVQNFQSLSFTRVFLLALILFFLIMVATGILGPSDWNWKRITFIVLSFLSLMASSVVSEHYLHDHIWHHIIKKHLFRVFLWSFGALLILDWGLSSWNMEVFIQHNLVWVMVIGALLGLIPESGPHLIFVMMYAKGLIPFSILLTASFIQDGHGMLPMLSYSLKDSLMIKAFNLVFGLGVGGTLLSLGL
jgi:hypothetical protein